MNSVNAIVIVFLSTIFYGTLNPLFKRAGEKISPFTVMAIATFTVFVCALIASFIFEKTGYKKGLPFPEVSTVVIAGLINFVGFWLILVGIKHLPVWQVTMVSLITPIVTGIAAYVLLGEKLSINMFIGLVIMGIGLYIAIR